MSVDTSHPDKKSIRTFNRALFDWYKHCARRFVWRMPPGTGNPDPYRVWLAEVMLQQTQVERAEPYFVRFTQRWPTADALAAAPLDQILAAWSGLGYYARARNLHACAGVLARTGFPRDPAELKKFPGIGPYTAAAIAAIAFGAPVAAVDANVRRVIARLTACQRTGATVWEKRIQVSANAFLDATRSGDWAQAMMDLGALVCRPRTPRCDICPVARHCHSLAQGVVDKVPGRAIRPSRACRTGAAFYLADGDQVLLVRRPERGLLGGTLALPGTAWTSLETDDSTSVPAPLSRWRKIGCVRQAFTHFDLVVDVWRADLTGQRPEGIWVERARIAEVGMASVFQKIARLAEDDESFRKELPTERFS